MMAKAVHENYALYDGFIIFHGTDTLAYSAAALSYLIQNADKPVILTGAQQPISKMCIRDRYNGMWMLQDLANNLPENWIVYQCIATADGTTALTYARDNSMRALMLDKIARSELIVFNRAERSEERRVGKECRL